MSLANVEDVATPPRRRHDRRRLLVDLVGYALASAAALACDGTVLVVLTRLGLDYRVAAFAGFTAGMGVAYTLSARFVFCDRRAASRVEELSGFVAVGLGGLLLTEALLFVLVSCAGIPVAPAKVPTAGAVFLFNFFCRRAFVFRQRGRSS